jgi:hypothetical protein
VRQKLRDVDPEPVVLYDVCRPGREESKAALAMNFARAAFGLPLVIAVAVSR